MCTPNDRHMECVHFGAIMNNAASCMNTYSCISIL